MIPYRLNPFGISARPYKRELAYLEGTGSQWIDTGVDVSSFDYVMEYSGNGYFLCGFCKQQDASGTWLGVRCTTLDHNLKAYFGSFSKTRQTTISTTWKFDMSSGFYVNGVMVGDSISITGVTQSVSGIGYPLFLMHNFQNDSKWGQGNNEKLYHFIVSRNSVLVRDFIPVLDKNDIPCMYDKVNKNLFYNNGTGQFLYGEK